MICERDTYCTRAFAGYEKYPTFDKRVSAVILARCGAPSHLVCALVTLVLRYFIHLISVIVRTPTVVVTFVGGLTLGVVLVVIRRRLLALALP